MKSSIDDTARKFKISRGKLTALLYYLQEGVTPRSIDCSFDRLTTTLNKKPVKIAPDRLTVARSNTHAVDTLIEYKFADKEAFALLKILENEDAKNALEDFDTLVPTGDIEDNVQLIVNRVKRAAFTRTNHTRVMDKLTEGFVQGSAVPLINLNTKSLANFGKKKYKHDKASTKLNEKLNKNNLHFQKIEKMQTQIDVQKERNTILRQKNVEMEQVKRETKIVDKKKENIKNEPTAIVEPVVKVQQSTTIYNCKVIIKCSKVQITAKVIIKCCKVQQYITPKEIRTLRLVTTRGANVKNAHLPKREDSRYSMVSGRKGKTVFARV